MPTPPSASRHCSPIAAPTHPCSRQVSPCQTELRPQGGSEPVLAPPVEVLPLAPVDPLDEPPPVPVSPEVPLLEPPVELPPAVVEEAPAVVLPVLPPLLTPDVEPEVPALPLPVPPEPRAPQLQLQRARRTDARARELIYGTILRAKGAA